MKHQVLVAITISVCTCLFSMVSFGQNVGIGNTDPAYKLDVSGNLHTTGYAYIDGNLGIGGYTNADPINYRITVKNGSLAIYNSTADVTWRMNYDPNTSGLAFSYGAGTLTSLTRLTIANTTGIVTAHNGLNVTGLTALSGNTTITGNANITGNAVVGGDKPVVRSGTVSGGNIKIHNQSYTVTAILAGHAQSVEFGIVWAAGIFNNRPTVFVGNEISTGGTVGQLYRVFVKLYDCNATSCKARLINTSPSPINYDITFDVMMIGD